MRDPHVKLTDEEQRQLQELELALTRDDPDLVRRLRGGRRIRLPGRPFRASSMPGFTAGVLLLVVGLVALFAVLSVSPVAAFGAYVTMFVGAWLMLVAPSTQRVCARLLGRTPDADEAGDAHDRRR
jgi:hypothetical protein